APFFGLLAGLARLADRGRALRDHLGLVLLLRRGGGRGARALSAAPDGRQGEEGQRGDQPAHRTRHLLSPVRSDRGRLWGSAGPKSNGGSCPHLWSEKGMA